MRRGRESIRPAPLRRWQQQKPKFGGLFCNESASIISLTVMDNRGRLADELVSSQAISANALRLQELQSIIYCNFVIYSHAPFTLDAFRELPP